ncbi:MAG: hypothetical protein AAF089_13260 [Bacteroidota bacterium]
MLDLTIVEVFSLLSSVASLVLAVVAILMARSSERDSRANFDRTQEIMNQQYDRTKDVLSEIDKRASIVERTVSDSQTKMLTTLTTIINETVIPKRSDSGEEIGMMVMQAIMSDPDAGTKIISSLMPLVEHGQRIQAEERQRLVEAESV